METAEAVITRLRLRPLPKEGGFFRRVWTGPIRNERPEGTAIFYLMTPDDYSAWHRLDADEFWDFRAGDAIDLWRLDPGPPHVDRLRLGRNPDRGQALQALVPAGHWQSARPAGPCVYGWSLVRCKMRPGWWDGSFTGGSRAALCDAFPQLASGSNLVDSPP